MGRDKSEKVEDYWVMVQLKSDFVEPGYTLPKPYRWSLRLFTYCIIDFKRTRGGVSVIDTISETV